MVVQEEDLALVEHQIQEQKKLVQEQEDSALLHQVLGRVKLQLRSPLQMRLRLVGEEEEEDLALVEYQIQEQKRLQ